MNDRKDPPDGRLSVGLVGYGRWGTNVARDLAACPGVRLSHIVDTSPEARARGAATFPLAEISDRLEDCLGRVDALAVCTPAALHFEHAALALEAGRHVFVEKPMAMSPHRAEALCGLATTGGLTLAVGHQMLYHELFMMIGEHLRGAGEPVSSIEARRSGPVDLGTEPDVLWAYGPHDVAMVLALTGRDPAQVRVSGASRSGAGDVLTAVTLELSFDGGPEARIHLDCETGEKVRTLEVIGARSRLRFDDHVPGGMLTLRESTGASRERIVTGSVQELPLARELAAFALSASDKAPRLDGGEMGLRVVRVLSEAADRAGAV